MLAEIWTYICALLSNWASLIWGTSLIFDVGGLVLRKTQYLAVGQWLDEYIAENTRVAVLRTLLVLGLLIAGFNAWDEQYRIAISKSPQALSEEVSKLQGQLNSVRDEIWIPLTNDEVAGLTASLRAAHIGGAKVSVIRPDTPDCAHVAEQVANALVGAGGILTDQPFHTIDGEAPGIMVTSGPTVEGGAIQSALAKAFQAHIGLFEAKQKLYANGHPADLAITIGLRIVQ
jgi:hypothetical protein